VYVAVAKPRAFEGNTFSGKGKGERGEGGKGGHNSKKQKDKINVTLLADAIAGLGKLFSAGRKKSPFILRFV